MAHHITISELFSALLGIVFVWSLKYSKEKDSFDVLNKPFSLVKWLKDWFLKKNDNIFIHLLFTFIAIYLGVDNLQAWLGDTISIPDGVDEVGAGFIIGFCGTYVVEILKKGV